jgi:hypothetical protein
MFFVMLPGIEALAKKAGARNGIEAVLILIQHCLQLTFEQ